MKQDCKLVWYKSAIKRIIECVHIFEVCTFSQSHYCDVMSSPLPINSSRLNYLVISTNHLTHHAPPTFSFQTHTYTMDFLKAEIARKKRLIEEKNLMQPEKKYFKRGDLAALQEQEYHEKRAGAETSATNNSEGDGTEGGKGEPERVEVIQDLLW